MSKRCLASRRRGPAAVKGAADPLAISKSCLRLRAADQGVATGAALATVAAATAVEGVVTGVAPQAIWTPLALQEIVAALALQRVGVGATDHGVAPRAAADEVGTAIGADKILAATGEHLVVAARVTITSARSVPVITSSPAVPVIVGLAQLALGALPVSFTTVLAVAWLLFGVLSCGLTTVAVFESVPVFFGWTTIVTVAVVPALIVPSEQVTIFALFSQVPLVGVAETKSIVRGGQRIGDDYSGRVTCPVILHLDRVGQPASLRHRVGAVALGEGEIGRAGGRGSPSWPVS